MVFTSSQLQKYLQNEEVLLQGKPYAQAATIKDMDVEEFDSVLTTYAQIQGSEPELYAVSLTYDTRSGEVERATCTCVEGNNTGICKHVAGLGLYLLPVTVVESVKKPTYVPQVTEHAVWAFALEKKKSSRGYGDVIAITPLLLLGENKRPVEMATYMIGLINAELYHYTQQATITERLQAKGFIKQGKNLLFPLGNHMYYRWNPEIADGLLQRVLPEEERVRQVLSQTFFEGSFEISVDESYIFPLLQNIEEGGKKYGWEIIKGEGMEQFSLRKETIGCDFAFRDTKADWFAFDFSAHMGEMALTEEKIAMILSTMTTHVDMGQGAYVEVSNKEQIRSLLDMCHTMEKKKKTYKGKLWQIPEMLYRIEKNQATYMAPAKVQDLFQEMKEGKPIEHVVLPLSLQEVLRPYQAQTHDWEAFLGKYAFGGILADDMGLGKTIQALSILALKKHKMPALIVCPKTLLYNWHEETKRFFPELVVSMIEGSSKERQALLKNKLTKKSDILITSYSYLQKDMLIYDSYSFDYMVIDEAQCIKNPKTQNAHAVKHIKAKRRLALTGTPLENNVSDVWSIFDFLMPGFLGNFELFRRDFMNPIMKYNDKDKLALFSHKIRPFVLRRTKEKVLTELPPKVEQNMYCDLSKEQLVLYSKTLAEIKHDIFDTVATKGFDRSRIEVLSALMKLRQICNHPAMVDPTALGHSSGKFEMLFELLAEAKENGQKVLLFSSFVKALHIIRDEFDKKDVAYCYLDGQTKDRAGAVASFQQDPEKLVFLLSIKAGGTGLNLTAADVVILLDPWWNPMVEMQAMDRAHRIGQQKSVNVYSLITKGTIEEKMLVLKEKKKALFQATLSDSGDLFAKLTWDDIQKLFT